MDEFIFSSSIYLDNLIKIHYLLALVLHIVTNHHFKESFMTEPFTGSPLNHPNAIAVGTYKGRLETQDFKLRTAIANIRKGVLPSKALLPNIFRLEMFNMVQVSGHMITESLATSGIDSRVHFILSEWDGNVLFIVVVTISHTNIIEAVVTKNPPEPNQSTRRRFAVISPI